MIVAVIPARGGSKRILKKNIRLFCGKEIIRYSIEKARRTGLFDRIIVSTDDSEIASIALKYGAEVPFVRPKHLSGDFVGTTDVINHTINWFKDNGDLVKYICCIYPTAPFISEIDIKEGYEKLLNSNKLFSFSVTSFDFPIQRAIKINKKGSIEPFFSNSIEKRSQDLEQGFHDAGQFYWGKPSGFLKKVPLFSKNSLPIILPRDRVQDIDTEEDWRRAELMYKALKLIGTDS